MKRKKLIVSIIAVFSLFISLGVSAKPVSAHSYGWWGTPRKVRVTKSVKIYQVDGAVPTYRREPIKSTWLRKGRTAKINHGWSYLWIVQAKGLSHGRYFWITNTNGVWYKLIK